MANEVINDNPDSDRAVPAADFYSVSPEAAASPDGTAPAADADDLSAAASAEPVTPEQEAALLRAALSEANEEIARQADAVQRGQADLANMRRRHDEERIGIRQQANSGLLVRLLPIVDELDLAVSHLDKSGLDKSGPAKSDGDGADAAADSWSEGVRLIRRKLAAFLESEGVTRIESLGQPFNPELHEAVGMAQVAGAEPGSIVEVLRQGYLLHNRVVQAAQVVVNQ